MSDASLQSPIHQLRQRVAVAGARTLRALDPSIEALLSPTALIQALNEAGIRRFFRPNEDELLREWFARFLNRRHALWEVLEESVMAMDGEPPADQAPESWRCFLVGYAAAAQLVRLDRYLVEDLADRSDIQRKLNEEDLRYGIARKQFTRVFESLSDPEQALRMRAAMRCVDENRARFVALRSDPVVGPLAAGLDALEANLSASTIDFLKLAARFAEHAFRRRGASARQKAAFSLIESGGRLASELRDWWTPKRVSDAVREELETQLRPGDVLITRHDVAFTNVFLPGFWPHAALYLGPGQAALERGLAIDEERRGRWHASIRTLEALKDGVRLRTLARTLAVDAFVVLRPALSASDIDRALERALTHEGKDYNFDFDFFRSDRLVCTEVVYRAFDGVAGFEIPLMERAGRPALSAEDLLDMALDTEAFELVACFGIQGCERRLAWRQAASALVERSYRDP